LLMREWKYRESPNKDFVVVFDEEDRVGEIRE